MRFLKFFIYLVFFVFSILFFTQNSSVLSQEMTFSLNLYAPSLQWETFSMPLFFILLLAFMCGCIITILPMIMDRLRLSAQTRKLKKELVQKDKELKAYRQLPIAGINKQEEAPQPPSAQ